MHYDEAEHEKTIGKRKTGTWIPIDQENVWQGEIIIVKLDNTIMKPEFMYTQDCPFTEFFAIKKGKND